MPVTAIFVVLAFASVLIAAVAYARMTHSTSRGRRAVLWTVRALAAAGLVIAFFQPTLRFTRLTADTAPLVVLVDASRSMGLFSADSLVGLVASALGGGANGHARQRRRVLFFCFGDSLRPCASPRNVRFTDRHSFLPQILDNEVINRAHDIILVSDGNFSNALLSPRLSEQKNWHYVRMPRIVNHPYVAVTAQALPDAAPQDFAAAILVQVSGYTAARTSLSLTCSQKGVVVSRRQVSVDSGFVTDSVRLVLPPAPVGAHLYVVRARLADSLESSCSVVSRVIKQSFAAGLYGAKPSLDKKFLALALENKTRWRIAPARGSAADVLFVFDWDSASRRLLDSLPQSGTAVFVGCVPCDSARALRPPALSFRVAADFASDIDANAMAGLPPLVNVVLCPGLRPLSTLVTAVAQSAAAGMRAQDTLPLLYESQYAKHRVLVFAASGLWRWDFWPGDAPASTPRQPFSDFLLARVSDLVNANTNRSFFVYPVTTPAYDTDSLFFRCVLPQQTLGLLARPPVLKLIGAKGDTLADTFRLDAAGGIVGAACALPPVPAGAYRLECSFPGDGGREQWSDSLTVRENISEFLVQAQNTTLLDQLGDCFDAADARDEVARLPGSAATAGETSTARQTLRIVQSWPLIAFIFALFGIEWILRKRWRMD